MWTTTAVYATLVLQEGIATFLSQNVAIIPAILMYPVPKITLQ